MLKKIMSLAVVTVLVLGVLSGCGANPTTSSAVTPTPESTSQAVAEPSAMPESMPSSVSESSIVLPEVVRVAALKGPTAMGMVKLMQDSEDGKTVNKYEFTVATTDEIMPNLIKGDIDIAAVPANLAATLYNNTKGEIQVISINTLGVLYMVEKGDTIKTIADLKGKTIYATGKGSTPEYVLNYILTQNGIDPTADVTIEYKSEAAEIVALLAQTEGGIALLPQPFVTSALAKVPGTKIALDMTEQWGLVSKDDSALITGVFVARKAFIQEFEQSIAIFSEEIMQSATYAQTNVEETSALIGKYGIVTEDIAKVALPFCNITYVDGDTMKNQLKGYLNVLFEQNPKSIGGSLPNEDFYYTQKNK